MLAQVHSNSYRAFDSINHPPLAILGVDVEWNQPQMLKACTCDANGPNRGCQSCFEVSPFLFYKLQGVLCINPFRLSSCCRFSSL